MGREYRLDAIGFLRRLPRNNHGGSTNTVSFRGRSQTGGGYESELEESLCHYLPPPGEVFILTSHNTIRDTHTLSVDVFIMTDKANASRGGGKRCRCSERRRDEV